ncbi:hypothetical protein V8D89_004696 [Ganoderma adspersum]
MDAREEFVPLSEASQLEVLVDGSVFIKHPGVGKSLFSFPAYSYPKPTGAPEIPFGVFHPLALDACRVITNHASGTQSQADFLAEDREGKTPVPIDDVSLLTPGDYYYFLGPPGVHTNCNYPIVKDFSAFRFPSRLPQHWYRARRSARLERGVAGVAPSSWMSTYVTSRDRYCALSGYRSFNRCAHLVPKSEEAWFEANGMCLYSMENHRAGIDTHTNGVSLRADLHRCLESNSFVFYPARDGAGFMAYFVEAQGYPDYTELFHRRLASIHPSVAVEFIYARFAYTVINLYRPNVFFDSVPDNEYIKRFEKDTTELPTCDDSEGENTAMFEPSEEPWILSGSNDELDKDCSSVSNASIPHSQELLEDGDERWKQRLFRRIPELATLEEVEDPPDVVDCHSETPHMLRLTSEYMKENPQVWQTSTTPEGVTRDDNEGWYAAWMTRPL